MGFIEKKNGVTVHSRMLSTFIDTKILTTTASVYISYSARALDASRVRGMTLRRGITCAVRMRTNNERERS